MTPAATVRWTVHFSGHVQGVGFRYTTSSIARRHEISGYVWNLPDGDVELVAEGTRDELKAFLREMRDQLGSHIRDERQDEQAASGEFPGFEIRR